MLRLLVRIFDSVCVTPAVVHEITDPVSEAQLLSALSDWLVEAAPTPDALARVPEFGSDADRQTLALALDNMPCVILTGDRQLARKADLFGVRCINPPQVVQALTEARILSAARPHLDRMIQRGFGIPPTLYEAILRSLGE